MIEARNNILMISGASPNAGKTFISSNLAAVVAQTERKYCLLIPICEKDMCIRCLMLKMIMVYLTICQENLV
jgi:Mrp family chromosome partitioning ATPase